jgi:SOS-response transcriptional repressor LexA
MSLQDVAQRAGCARSYLSMLETGARDGMVSAELLARLETALALEPGDLARVAFWGDTPAGMRRRLRELEETQRAAAAALKAALGSGHGEPGPAGARLDEAYKSGRLAALIAHLEGPAHAGAPERSRVGALLPVQVPLINSVAAGYPREFTDLSYPARVADEYVRVPDVCDPDAFAARIVGDSMLPDYRQGDIVVFSPSRPAKSGSDCFVRLERDSETTFKRVFFEGPAGQEIIRLVALNAAYPERRFPREDVAGLYPAVSVTRVLA